MGPDCMRWVGGVHGWTEALWFPGVFEEIGPELENSQAEDNIFHPQYEPALGFCMSTGDSTGSILPCRKIPCSQKTRPWLRGVGFLC